MAKAFTNFTFGESFTNSFNQERQRQEATRQFEENNQLRYKELAERIEARQVMDQLREQKLAEGVRQFDKGFDQNDNQFNQTMGQRDKEFQVKMNENRYQFDESIDQKELDRNASATAQDKTIQQQKELYDMGKTKEERQAANMNKAVMATVPTFEQYDQNEAVTEAQDFMFFDEGEFSRASEQYIGDVTKNIQTIVSVINKNPNDPSVNKHLDDLQEIKEVLAGGEYKGVLDSTVLDWFDGEATGAKKQVAQIDNILRATGRLD